MIEIKQLVKRFENLAALDNLSFNIQEGSIFGLVGSNGAGKSTLLRCISGVYASDGGEILVDGETPFENENVQEKVIFISDYPYFFPQATLKSMAKFYKRIYHSWDDREYRHLKEVFGLDEKKRLHNMSKGMQRKAALICALAAKPQYLLLDEIFDGLDPVMRQLLKRIIIDKSSNEGLTVVIASHNLRELEDCCDHIGLIHEGGVIFEQELNELKLGIIKAQAAFNAPLQTQQMDWIKAQLNVITTSVNGSVITIVAKSNEENVKRALKELGPILVETLPLSLEEVFISEMEAVGYDIDKIIS